MSSIYPPLRYRDVIAVLRHLGFTQSARKSTSHEKWVKPGTPPYVVTVDRHEEPFDDFLIQSMAKQAGLSKKAFYEVWGSL